MVGTKLVHVGSLKKGNYVVVDGVACVVKDCRLFILYQFFIRPSHHSSLPITMMRHTLQDIQATALYYCHCHHDREHSKKAAKI